MTASEGELRNIEEFAYALMSPKEISIILGWDFNVYGPLFLQEGSQVYSAYQKGFLKVKYELNIDNIKFAKQGNAHAMNKVLENWKEILLLELKAKKP